MYTEAQLNGKNKSQVIVIALNAMANLEAIANAPANPNAIRGAMINLKREIGLSKERTTSSINEFKLAKLELEKASEKAIAELELKYQVSAGEDQEKMLKEFKALEERVGKAKLDLTFGLELAQNEHTKEMEEIKTRLLKAKESHDEEVADYKQAVVDATAAAGSEIKSIVKAHDRKVEQLLYDNKIAIRDNDKEYLERITKKLSLSTIPSDELTELQSFKSEDAKSVQTKIDEAVTAAKASVHQSEGAKYSALKSGTDQIIAIDKNNITNLTNNLAEARSRINELETRLKDVPSQIAKAVEAAKGEIVVNQDANKK